MDNNRIFLSSPHMSGDEQQYIQEAFAMNWIAPLGPNVDAFEQALATKIGVAGSAVLSSGTAAIHLALKLLAVGAGDEVFCSSLTFAASANPILYQQAIPVFIDSEYKSWNMSPQALKRALVDRASKGKLPKAVIIVNLYGQSADYEPLLELCNTYQIPVLEDAAESLGAEYHGNPSGSFGRYAIFSFNGNKIITTAGGGAVVANDLAALAKVRFWATQAREQALHYQHNEIGYNYRLSNVLAGIGRGQLQVLAQRVKARRQIFDRYAEKLAHLPGLNFMPEMVGSFSTRWLTTLTIQPELAGTTHLEIISKLSAANIESRPVWKPLHLQPVFQAYDYYPHQVDESVSDKIFAQGLCLPSGSNMTITEQERVIKIIKECLHSS